MNIFFVIKFILSFIPILFIMFLSYYIYEEVKQRRIEEQKRIEQIKKTKIIEMEKTTKRTTA